MIVLHPHHSPAELLKQLDTLKLSDLQKFQNDLFSEFRYTTFFAGNILREEAVSYTEDLKDLMSEASVDAAQLNRNILQVVNLKGKSIAYAF